MQNASCQRGWRLHVLCHIEKRIKNNTLQDTSLVIVNYIRKNEEDSKLLFCLIKKLGYGNIQVQSGS